MAAQWTSLSEVRESKVSGHFKRFPPALVYVGNYVARGKYPFRFTCLECPHQDTSGLVCGKTIEVGPRCNHELDMVPAFKFQLFLFDAHHLACPPLRAVVWEAASTLLGCSALDFSIMSEANQVKAIDHVVHKCPRIQAEFVVRDLEVYIQSITIPTDCWLSPLPTPASASGGRRKSGRTRTPIKEEQGLILKKPKSAKRILLDGLGDIMYALHSGDNAE